MSQTKKRLLWLTAAWAVGLTAFAALTGMPELWPCVFIALASAVRTARAPIDDEPNPPNQFARATALVLSAVVGAGCVIWGAGHDWRWIVLGGVLLMGVLPGLWLVARDRDAWWLRGASDYRRG